jgi:hypothetical protein
LVNGDREIIIRLMDAAAAGNEIYAETQNVTVVDGLYTFCLGASNAIPGTLSSAFMTDGLWVEMDIDGSTLSPREQLKAAAYAAVAAAVPSGTITSVMVLDGTISNADLAPDSVDAAALVDVLDLDADLTLTGANVVVAGSLSVTGNVSAAGFSGNGSGLSNVGADTLGTLEADSFLRSDAANIWNDDQEEIDFQFSGEADANLLYLETSGNRVGIGDPTPDGKLVVRQNAAADILNLYDGAANVLSVLDGGDVDVDANTLFIDADQDRVGIGEGTPAAKLDVNQGTAASILNLQDSGTVVLEVRDGGDFVVDADTLFVDASTDEVGIGTSNPSTELDIQGDVNGEVEVEIVNVNAGADADADLEFSTFGQTYQMGIDASDGELKIVNGAEFSSGTAGLSVNSFGHVGIGKSLFGILTPLYVSGSNDIGRVTIAVNNDGAGDPMVGFRLSGSTRFAMGIDNSANDNLVISEGVTLGVNNRFVIETTTGNIGIKRTPTTHDLEVEGSAGKTDGSTLWTVTSDRRAKKDVQDIPDALALVNALHPVRYAYNESYREKYGHVEHKTRYGFIAQEYKELFPEDVVRDESTDYWQLDASAVSPHLVAAVQELHAQNTELEERLVAMQKRLAALEAR